MDARSLPKSLDNPDEPDPGEHRASSRLAAIRKERLRLAQGSDALDQTALKLDDFRGSIDLPRRGDYWTGHRRLMAALAKVQVNEGNDDSGDPDGTDNPDDPIAA